MDASSRECFELLSLTVDGDEVSVRRSERRHSQAYVATLPDSAVIEGHPVRIRHIYRVVTPTWGHRLFVQLPQPARNVTLSMDYTNTDIAYLSVTDTVSSKSRAQIYRLPEDVPGRAITVDIPGWLLPSAGFAFTWTLNEELPRSEHSKAA
jgi:hypothetical protein